MDKIRRQFTLTPGAYGSVKQCGETTTSLNCSLPTISLVC